MRGLFKRKKTVTTRQRRFRYMVDSALPFRHDETGVKCDCCGKLTHEIYENGFESSDFEGVLCPECIASGKASQQYDASFHMLDQCEKVHNPLAEEDLERRTPRLDTFQFVQWPACCNDFCVFLREMTEEDFENTALMEALADDIGEWELPEEGVKEAHALLFYCPNCGKYRAFIDLD